MTFSELQQLLSSMPASAPLVFETQEGVIGAGYHVTELKSAQITSIDCGARIANWTEASLQLLDGQGDAHMPVGKFLGILNQSLRRVEGLGISPMHVEFAHGNIGMRRYEMTSPVLENEMVVVKLSEDRAQCKPALDFRTTTKTTGCCGSSAQACCG